MRRLRFRLKAVPDPAAASDALAELRQLFDEDPTFAYAELLAVRQGIWHTESTAVPSFAAAFEEALREEDRAKLKRCPSAAKTRCSDLGGSRCFGRRERRTCDRGLVAGGAAGRRNSGHQHSPHRAPTDASDHRWRPRSQRPLARTKKLSSPCCTMQTRQAWTRICRSPLEESSSAPRRRCGFRRIRGGFCARRRRRFR